MDRGRDGGEQGTASWEVSDAWRTPLEGWSGPQKGWRPEKESSRRPPGWGAGNWFLRALVIVAESVVLIVVAFGWSYVGVRLFGADLTDRDIEPGNKMGVALTYFLMLIAAVCSPAAYAIGRWLFMFGRGWSFVVAQTFPLVLAVLLVSGQRSLADAPLKERPTVSQHAFLSAESGGGWVVSSPGRSGGSA